jgi:Ca2+-binding EF-hand superfamily protein
VLAILSIRGAIEESDIELLLLALNINMTPSEINAVISEIGSNSNLITFEDFFRWWWNSPERK